jgi:hypothetical protein
MLPQQIKFDRDTALVVERGREAWRDLKRDESWEKWVTIGRAIEAGRIAIMAYLGTNQPKGRTWSEVFGAWLKENEFDQIDKGARSRLQACIENLPAIEAWRSTLGLGRRLELNHPSAVLRNWQRATLPTTAAEPRERKTASHALYDAADRVNEAADRIEEKTGATSGYDLSSPAAIEASLDAFCAVHEAYSDNVATFFAKGAARASAEGLSRGAVKTAAAVAPQPQTALIAAQPDPALAAAYEEAQARIATLESRLNEMARELTEAFILLDRKGIFSRTEYRKIRACLHPDHSLGEKAMTEAFHLIADREQLLVFEESKPKPLPAKLPETVAGLREWMMAGRRQQAAKNAAAARKAAATRKANQQPKAKLTRPTL